MTTYLWSDAPGIELTGWTVNESEPIPHTDPEYVDDLPDDPPSTETDQAEETPKDDEVPE